MSKSVPRRARDGEGKDPRKSHRKHRRAGRSAPTPAASPEGGFSPLGAGLDVRARLPLDGRRLTLSTPAFADIRTPRRAGVTSASAVASVYPPAATRLGAAPGILASLPPVAPALSQRVFSNQCQPDEQQGGGAHEMSGHGE